MFSQQQTGFIFDMKSIISQQKPFALNDPKWDPILKSIFANYQQLQSYDDKIIFESILYKEIFGSAIPPKKYGRYNKLNGDIFSVIISKNIQEILVKQGGQYSIIPHNCYVVGCPIEWDAIIVKNGAQKALNMNIYSPDDIKVLIEYKASGFFGRTDPQLMVKQFKNTTQAIKTFGSKYAYITLSEFTNTSNFSSKKTGTKDYLELTRELLTGPNNKFNNLASYYCFINNRALTAKQIDYTGSGFEDFVINLIK